jgi:hypothetical protein
MPSRLICFALAKLETQTYLILFFALNFQIAYAQVFRCVGAPLPDTAHVQIRYQATPCPRGFQSVQLTMLVAPTPVKGETREWMTHKVGQSRGGRHQARRSGETLAPRSLQAARRAAKKASAPPKDNRAPRRPNRHGRKVTPGTQVEGFITQPQPRTRLTTAPRAPARAATKPPAVRQSLGIALPNAPN